MEAATKWTEAELDGVRLVLCDNYEHLFVDRDYWEDKYQYEFDRSELREYVNEWQDAVLRNLEARGIDTDHITVDIRYRGYHYWNELLYRSSPNEILLTVGAMFAPRGWSYDAEDRDTKKKALMRTMMHAACDAHDWITERIERDLRFRLGQIAAEAISKFLQEVNA